MDNLDKFKDSDYEMLEKSNYSSSKNCEINNKENSEKTNIEKKSPNSFTSNYEKEKEFK